MTAEGPSVSVLMAVFNERPDFLNRAIESIVDQTWADWEFLVVDDGSDDSSTRDILEMWVQRDPRFRLLRTRHAGLTRALNVGLLACRGEFILRQDSDDWSAPDRIRKQVEFLRSKPDCGVVGSGVKLHMQDGRSLWTATFPRTGDEIRASFPRGNPFHHGALCFRASSVREVGGYCESIPCAQDYDLTWRISEVFDCHNLPYVLYHYRKTAGAISARFPGRMDVMRQVIKMAAEERAGGRSFSSEEIRAAVIRIQTRDRARLERLCLQKAGDALLLAGHFGPALRSHGRAFQRTWRLAAFLRLLRACFFILVPALRKGLFSVSMIVPGRIRDTRA